MTLDEFIARPDLRNGFVKQLGFNELYVRNSKRLWVITAQGVVRKKPRCLDIARVSVTPARRGKGVFKNLLLRLRDQHPDMAVYVECVFPERLQDGLLRMGFKIANSWWGGAPPTSSSPKTRC